VPGKGVAAGADGRDCAAFATRRVASFFATKWLYLQLRLQRRCRVKDHHNRVRDTTTTTSGSATTTTSTTTVVATTATTATTATYSVGQFGGEVGRAAANALSARRHQIDGPGTVLAKDRVQVHLARSGGSTTGGDRRRSSFVLLLRRRRRFDRQQRQAPRQPLGRARLELFVLPPPRPLLLPQSSRQGG
jgi:hypothetical protein